MLEQGEDSLNPKEDKKIPPVLVDKGPLGSRSPGLGSNYQAAWARLQARAANFAASTVPLIVGKFPALGGPFFGSLPAGTCALRPGAPVVLQMSWLFC